MRAVDRELSRLLAHESDCEISPGLYGGDEVYMARLRERISALRAELRELLAAGEGSDSPSEESTS